MEQPPPPLSSSADAMTTTTNQHYADSLDYSPRSRHTDSWDDPPSLNTNATTATANNAAATAVLTAKLRLMCSYGGHIVPRPHDKSLCYVGGDTRIIVVDRNVTLGSLMSRLSKSLLNGGSFILKYQLPSEDLDSLISVTTDEDLENMIEEYERTTSNLQKPCRLRLFLFQQKLESSQSILETKTIKSDEWFLNALNGSAGDLNTGFSDSASVNCLLGLDDEIVTASAAAGGRGSTESGGGGMVKKVQDVHSVPDSPMMETTSSFGSSSSSPSMANLPPIRVHVEESGKVQDPQKVTVGIEEQFAQMNVGGLGGGAKLQQEEGFVVLSPPPPPVVVPSVGLVSGDYVNRVVSDDERSDHGVPVGYKKTPAPPQSLPQKSGGGGALDLPSPDSVASDSSLTNAIARQKPVMYQDHVVQISSSGGNRVAVNVNPIDAKANVSDPNARVHMQQQVSDSGSGYVLQQQLDQQQLQQQQQLLQQQQQQQQLLQQQQQQQQQLDQQQLQQQQQLHQQQYQQHQQQHQQQQQQQQQYIQAGTHYMHHHPAGAVPISAYYPAYPSQQQPQVQHHQQHHQLDQQYQVYYMPTRQPQAYNLSVQQQPQTVSESPTAIPSSRPQTPPSPAMVSQPTAYNPIRNTHITKPEMAASAGMYRTTAAADPQLVQVPSSQHQQQYVGYAQIHHPSQSVAPTSVATSTANYGYEFVDPTHAQIYYTQPLAPTMPSQYQTMTSSAAVSPEASAQLSTENIKQQIRTSQPL